MGIEATCRVETGEGAGEARVFLETSEILARGAIRARIPLAEVERAEVDGGRLIISHQGTRTVLHLGPMAAHWADRILHPKSRLDKLGVKPGMIVSVRGISDTELRDELTAAGVAPAWGRLRRESDLIFLGVEQDEDVARIAKALPSLRQTGAIWVIHPKGKDGVKDTTIFAAGRKAGLVATKVAKFSESHTAEKLVIPGRSRTT